MRLILLRRHRKKHGRSILEYLAGWLAYGKTSSRFQFAIDVPDASLLSPYAVGLVIGISVHLTFTMRHGRSADDLDK
jgi:hypothetical protein